MDIKELENIVRILKQNDVTEFELEHNGTHLKLSRLGGGQLVVATAPSGVSHEVRPAVTTTSVPAPSANGTAAATEVPASWVKVESPIVGTFYRKPSPDSEVFVKEGASVKKGDTLCIVEAMKLMNEIEAPCSGKVEKICLTDGHVVEYGEVLFLINPSA